LRTEGAAWAEETVRLLHEAADGWIVGLVLMVEAATVVPTGD